MDLFSNNISYQDIVNQIKHWIIINNKNSGILSELNVEGSNISTIIDALAYVYMVSNFKNEIYFNEFSLQAKIPSNVIKRVMDFGVIPITRRASKIKLLLQNKTSSEITLSADSEIYISTQNPNINFYTKFDERVYISQNIPLEIEFYDLIPQVSQTFSIDTNFTKLSNVELPYKFEIDYNSFSITNLQGDIFKQFDNTVNLSETTVNTIYYYFDLTGETLKVKFLGGFVGKTYNGNIVISYGITNGDIANGISDSTMKIKSISGSSVPLTDLTIVSQNNISFGGNTESNIEVLRKSATTTFKSQQSIITKDDLMFYFKNLYPSYEVIVKTPEEQYMLTSAGYIYVAIYRVKNGIIEHFDYTNIGTEALYKKLTMGVKIFFFNVTFVDINFNINLIVNKNINANIIENSIKTLIANNFSNKKYFTKYNIQEKILSSNLNGIVSLNIDNLQYSINRTISTYKTNSLTYKCNSYEKLPLSTFERIIEVNLRNVNVTDSNNTDIKSQVSQNITNSFNNVGAENIFYQFSENFKIIPIPLKIENYISNIPLKVYSKKLNNCSIKITLTDNQTFILSNILLRQTQIGNNGVGYFVDNDLIHSYTEDNEIKYLTLFQKLDKSNSKKVLGFTTDDDNKNFYMVCNENFINVGDLTVTKVEVIVDNDNVLSYSDVVIVDKDNISITTNKI